jgi:hypothetical protein
LNLRKRGKKNEQSEMKAKGKKRSAVKTKERKEREGKKSRLKE